MKYIWENFDRKEPIVEVAGAAVMTRGGIPVEVPEHAREQFDHLVVVSGEIETVLL